VRDPLLAYLAWFLQQTEAFRFDAEPETARSAVVIPFRPGRPS
jgi:hypothetical protein